MSAQFAAVLGWSSILLWVLLGALFLFDAIRVHRFSRRDYAIAKDVGNGRTRLAFRRNRASMWYMVGSGVALSVGLLALYFAATAPSPPSPEERVLTSVYRALLIFMLFAFWRTKRNNLAVYHEVDRPLTRLEGVARDTNLRVREIQERGISDRPHEETDRSEGRRHRSDMEGRMDDAEGRLDENDARRDA